MNGALVSVVIPTRNRWELVSRALASVLQQVDVELEVVIVDEGSSDGTRERLAAVKDDRITYLRNEHPTGVANARNRGISEARGEWIALLDDDDLWAPMKLGSQLDACAAGNADFAYTGVVTTDRALESRTVSRPPSPRSLRRDLLESNVIGPPSCVIVRRPLLMRVGGFDPDYSILADWDFCLRLAAAGRPAACEAPLTAYVTHHSNMHLDARGAVREFRRLRRKHATLAGAEGRKLGGRRFWGWIASSLRRSGHRYQGAGLFLILGVRYARPDLIARAGATLVGERGSDRVRRLLPADEDIDAATGPAAASWLDEYRQSGRTPDSAAD